MRHNPFKIVRMFEETVADYCGSKYAVATDNCTDALLLCCQYLKVKEVTIPCRTYLSVPQSIIHAGGTVQLKDYNWKGVYQLEPYPIYDAAKRFTSEMYIPDTFMCLSFHTKKHLKIGKGGMILTDDKSAAEWFTKARYEGRDHVNDQIEINGWNAYMSPDVAARGLMLIQNFPEHNEDLTEIPDYRDLREMPLFRNCKAVKE